MHDSLFSLITAFQFCYAGVTSPKLPRAARRLAGPASQSGSARSGGLVDLSPPIPALPGKPLYPRRVNVTQILQDVPFPDRGRKISDFWFLRIDKTAISRYDITRRRGRGAMRQRLGSIAQLGEHLPYKQRVTGSSPVVPTIIWPGGAVG